MPPTLLLCGHGYLGQAIARDFSDDGWNVVALSRNGGDGSLTCDLASEVDVAALCVTPDFIVHCAASGRGGPDAYRSVYLQGCQHLLRKFPETPLLFTSSTSVYGQTDGSEVTEESPAEPDRETGRILLETESLVLKHGGIVTRLAGIYGPSRSILLSRFLNGDAIIEEDGRRLINQIHRDDAATAILHLAKLNRHNSLTGLFNLSDSTPMAQIDLYRALSDRFSRPLPPVGPRDLNRKRGWTHKRVSNLRLRQTAWTPKYPSFLDAVSELAPTLNRTIE